MLDRAVDLAFAELTAGVTEQRARHAELEGELSAIQTRIDRLLDALADGSVPRDEVAARLNAEKTRKDALTSERARLSGMLIVADLDTEKIKADLHDKVRDVKGLLGRQVPQARQMLRKLLADKIDIEPVGSGRQRGFKFRGALTVDRLIGGDAIVGANNTPVSGGPKRIWHTDVLPRRVTYLPFVFRTILTGNLRETRLAVLRGRWRRLRGTWSRVHVVIDALTGQTPPVEGEPTFPSPAAERTDGETAAFRSTQRLLHFFVIGLLRRTTQRS